MNDSNVIFEKAKDGLAWVTLNRPDVLNALNMAARDELWEVMQAVAVDPEVRAVIFKGAGERAFSAGADISEFGTAPSYVESRRARRERDLWWLMLTQEKLLVAAIQGYALGAGIELAMCCDIRIASEDATIGLPEVSLGYIPSAGGTQTLPRYVPPGIAMQMILTGDSIDAQTAYGRGLVNRVVARERLYAEAEAFARKIIARPGHLVALARRAIYEGADTSLDEGLALEGRLVERAILGW